MRLTTNDYLTDDKQGAIRTLGRNDRCWCGSGKKYKVCHLDREKQKPTGAWEADAAIHARDKNSECLHVGSGVGNVCGKPAINSHTVSRKMLKQIARSGHVYWHSGSVQDLAKNQGRLTVKPIGVNDASALRVFCRPHDNDAFVPLEQEPFVGSQEQCFLLA
jgi:SEC-C motif